uniref:Scaffolding anchor of CK1 domain-containing protein n=1 Tax=Mola mola TaxID=94237 RepID=A0A3Q3XG98_MOLML
MAHRSQSSSIGDNPLDPNYLPPHYREDYRLAIDALIEKGTQGYYEFLQTSDLVSFLAQSEIEHIKSTIQTPNLTSIMPELTYLEAGHELDGSSDTYWPVQSDLAAPGLDLGWPMPQHCFMGPTEVTTLVNPSDQDMPSIKDQARRLIKNAQQVIAVVMDTFTDVDIFADLLDAAARHVPVYILLDEQESYQFVSMVINCKVLIFYHMELIMMRVRTVAGITYYSRTGKSFKGQVKDRFLLADCNAVLCGNYSFMWSYEKIHRCLAHLFLGALVSTFDEEFRILYAQSEPLVIDPSDGALAVPDTNSYYGSQFGLTRTQSLRNPIGYRRPQEISSAFSYGDSDRNLALPFRRNDPFRQTIETGTGITIGKYSQQQFRVQQSIVSRTMELSASTLKRHSYAEGTQESYTSSRKFMKHRVLNNLDEADFLRYLMLQCLQLSQDPGSGFGLGQFDRLRGRPSYRTTDQYSDSSFRSDQDLLPGNYARDYFSSEDLRGPEEHQAPPLAGRYGGSSSNKRPSIGQAYACQKSQTQPHTPEKKHFLKQSDQEHDQDAVAKQGLRSWRIHSYLSAYEDSEEEGLTKSQDSVPSIKDLKPLVPEKKEREEAKETEKKTERGAVREVGVDVEAKETPELFLSKHESFRSRYNPLLQRSSRLRSSLIFSSSKAEMHTSDLGLKLATEEDEQLDSVRTSSIVAKMLEKRRSFSREPFEWRKRIEKVKENVKEKEEKAQQQEENETKLKDGIKAKEAPEKTDKEVKVTPTVEKSEGVTPSSVKKNDPDNPKQYFKDIAAKRKASKVETQVTLKVQEPVEKKPDLPDKSPLNPVVTPKTPTISINSEECEPQKLDIAAKLAELTRRPSISSSKLSVSSLKPSVSYLKPSETTQPLKEENASESQKKSLKPLPSPKMFKKDPLKFKGLNPRRISCDEEILTRDATDAEKSELKKSRSQSSSTLQRHESKEGLQKVMGSNTSINTLGEGKGDSKTRDLIKKHTQKIMGILAPKDKDKKSSGDDKGMSKVLGITEASSKKQNSLAKDTASTTTDQTTTNNKTSGGISGPPRYQAPGSTFLFTSNLRDDTKVILEQISANSQKNRLEREETKGDNDSDSVEKALERQNSIRRNIILRPQGNNQEREGLLKRIESLRKEKKVYSRFEVG